METPESQIASLKKHAQELLEEANLIQANIEKHRADCLTNFIVDNGLGVRLGWTGELGLNCWDGHYVLVINPCELRQKLVDKLRELSISEDEEWYREGGEEERNLAKKMVAVRFCGSICDGMAKYFSYLRDNYQ